MYFVVLSSSRGTTFQAALDAINDGSLTMRCIGLVTDKPERECIDKAHNADIPVSIVEKIKDEPREEFDKRVHDSVRQLLRDSAAPQDHTVIAEMGWMWIHTPWFINQWKNRILNVHPALLPKYGGTGMYGDRVHRAVLEANESETGVTIHVMDEGVDTGEILVQKSCTIKSDDTVESVKKRVQELEKEWYPKTLQMIETHAISLPEQ